MSGVEHTLGAEPAFGDAGGLSFKAALAGFVVTTLGGTLVVLLLACL